MRRTRWFAGAHHAGYDALGGTLANECGELRALRGKFGNLMLDCFDALRSGGTN